MKRLVAYSSVSHLGFVFVGLFALNPLALQGSVLLMVSHGVATGGLFIVAGCIEQRLARARSSTWAGCSPSFPVSAAPGSCSGSSRSACPDRGTSSPRSSSSSGPSRLAPLFAVLIAGGLVFSVAYALWMIQRAFHGRPPRGRHRRPLGRGDRHGARADPCSLLAGLSPQPISTPQADSCSRSGRDRMGTHDLLALLPHLILADSVGAHPRG